MKESLDESFQVLFNLDASASFIFSMIFVLCTRGGYSEQEL